MNCCDEYGDCQQGRNCPARTRRVRAGGPPPDELPIQYADDGVEPPDFVGIAIFIVVVSIIFALVAMAWSHYL